MGKNNAFLNFQNDLFKKVNHSPLEDLQAAE